MHLFFMSVLCAYSAKGLVAHFTINHCVPPGSNLLTYTVPYMSVQVPFIVKDPVTGVTLVYGTVQQLLPVLFDNFNTMCITLGDKIPMSSPPVN